MVRADKWYSPLVQPRGGEAMKRPGWVVALLAVLAALVAAGAQASTAERGDREADKRVVGYFIEWGIYGRQYFVKNVVTSGSASRLDVVNYAFSNVAPDAAGNVVCKLG